MTLVGVDERYRKRLRGGLWKPHERSPDSTANQHAESFGWTREESSMKYGLHELDNVSEGEPKGMKAVSEVLATSRAQGSQTIHEGQRGRSSCPDEQA